MLHLPAPQLPSSIFHSLRSTSDSIEVSKQLLPCSLEMIYQNRWLQVLVPKSLGGLEWPLPKIVQLFEDLARAEANTGWCVNLGAGANMFSGYLPVQTAVHIFGSAQTWCAGSGAQTGQAKVTEGGYVLSGRWKYASGANHATHFTANAWLVDDAQQKEPAFRSFIIPAHEVLNHRNWEAIGLKSTSSNDFSIDKIFVPHSATFSLSQPSTQSKGALYQFPFSTLAIVNMACMMTGITLHFLELFLELARQKKPLHQDILLADNAVVQKITRQYGQQFFAARQRYFDALAHCWEAYEKGEQAVEEDLYKLEQAGRQAAANGFTLLQQLYPLCGMSIVHPESALNKVWRDVHTASQHYLLSPIHD